MRVAQINITKPEEGSGDGITEYSYQIFRHTQRQKGMHVDSIYALEKTKRNNTMGLLYTNTIFKNRLSKMMDNGYDIIHITNQELGFAAKLIKKRNKNTRIITTIHDAARLEKGLHKGLQQSAYNMLVSSSINDAVKYSDFILFDSTLSRDMVMRRHIVHNFEVVPLGIKNEFIREKLSRKPMGRFVVGYIGSLAQNKNTTFILKTANVLKGSKIRFLVYGTGVEHNKLLMYKKAYDLQNVELMGFAPEERLSEIYDSFNAFMFPSLYEGFGLPILSAQARGLPVILYKAGKIPSEAKRYCFEAADENQAAEMVRMIKRRGYDEKRKRRSMAYARGFTWSRCTKRVVEIYKQILD